jgi:hypothetical protein
MSTASFPAVVSSSRFVPLVWGFSLDRVLKYTSGWAGVACLGIAFIIYASTRSKHNYVTGFFVLLQLQLTHAFPRCSGYNPSNRENWFIYIVSRCDTVHDALQRVYRGGLCQGE